MFDAIILIVANVATTIPKDELETGHVKIGRYKK